MPAGNYSGLAVNDKTLFWLTSTPGEKKMNLQAVTIDNEREPGEVKTVVEGVKAYELSDDGKKLLVRKEDSLYIIDAAAAVADLTRKEVPLSDWALSVTPREEWRQMFVESWRLERDYFYDKGMNGVDWKAMLKKYQPLVERVNSRAELADLMPRWCPSCARCTFSSGRGRRAKVRIQSRRLSWGRCSHAMKRKVATWSARSTVQTRTNRKGSAHWRGRT
jgi:hypothetical protein